MLGREHLQIVLAAMWLATPIARTAATSSFEMNLTSVLSLLCGEELQALTTYDGMRGKGIVLDCRCFLLVHLVEAPRPA